MAISEYQMANKIASSFYNLDQVPSVGRQVWYVENGQKGKGTVTGIDFRDEKFFVEMNTNEGPKSIYLKDVFPHEPKLVQEDGQSRYSIIKKCPEKNKDDRPESEQKWCLFDSEGEKLLGRHPTKERAENQERAIQVHKHSHLLRKIAVHIAESFDLTQAKDTAEQMLDFSGRPQGRVMIIPGIDVEFNGDIITLYYKSEQYQKNPGQEWIKII